MKILWVTNLAIPQIAEDIGIEVMPIGGWMVKLADEMALIPNIELTIAFPYNQILNGRTKDIAYYSFFVDPDKVRIGKCGKQGDRIEEIISLVEPDCIHIFGTEKEHTYVFTEVAKKLGMIDKVVISIQGMVSFISRHYEAFLPHKIVVGKTFRDLIKGNIAANKKHFEEVGILETEAIKNIKHVIGRTDWDRACTSLINPEAKYHFNNEMLRESFYSTSKWDYHTCVPHSIFMSQATFPLKGLHIVIEAMALLKAKYPDIHLNVSGKSYTDKKKYALSKYERYVLRLLEKSELKDNVTFTGFLNENAIKEEYLKTNVFVSASSIENSPNSLCEAMALGVPVVCSFVGGVSNLVEHSYNGYLYQADAPYMLAYYIEKIFQSIVTAQRLGSEAYETARKRHAIAKILNDLLSVYIEITGTDL